jgi:hypothetical protein
MSDASIIPELPGFLKRKKEPLPKAYSKDTEFQRHKRARDIARECRELNAKWSKIRSDERKKAYLEKKKLKTKEFNNE